MRRETWDGNGAINEAQQRMALNFATRCRWMRDLDYPAGSGTTRLQRGHPIEVRGCSRLRKRSRILPDNDKTRLIRHLIRSDKYHWAFFNNDTV